MQKAITVAYTLDSTTQELVIPISYAIETDDELRIITCTVDAGMAHLPSWLQRKFRIRLRHTHSGYELLYNENNVIRSLDTSLFIDKVHAMVMAKEKMRMMPAEF